jgi:DNA recombination protein RmuC
METPVIVALVLGGVVIGIGVALLVGALRAGGSQRLSTTLGTINGRLDQIESISREVAELSQVFLVPRTRGGVGETLLAQLLANWLPDSAYSLQYNFAAGGRVDAVIRLGSFLVPIDAKFPLESVRRSMEHPEAGLPTEVKQTVRRHGRDIAERYIQPDEGTMEFALMYLPAERVYHYLFVEHESAGLYESLIRDRVVPVSPGNLFLYLTTVAYGLRGLAIPERYREMLALVRQIRQDFHGLEQGIGVLTTHLRNASKSLDGLRSQSAKVDERLSRLEEG